MTYPGTSGDNPYPQPQQGGRPPMPQSAGQPSAGYNTTETQLAQLQRQQMAESRYQDARKSEGIAYLLWFFLGIVGGHRFYARSTGVALGMLFTLGGIGLWALIDVFFIGRRIKNVNADIRREVYGQYGIPVA
jgi:TM2 domain-containing membrane protein YozV